MSTTLDAAMDLRASGQLAEALETLTSAGDYDASLCNLRGEIEFEMGRFQDAAMSYLTIAVSQPENADAHFNLGLCLQRAGRWDAAVEAFQRTLRLDPERVEARLGLGACLLELSRPEEALAHFGYRSTGINREAALFGTAVALHMLERLDEAESAYEMLLASHPNSEEVLSNLIAANMEAHDLEQVREYSHRLLEISPNSAVALKGLATVALERWDHQEATSYCDRILELAPGCLEAWHNLRIAIDRSLESLSQAAFAVHSGVK